MFMSPRVVAIDNDPGDLKALVEGLNLSGIECLAVPFPEGVSSLEHCPNLRVLFADLHLEEDSESSDSNRYFATIGGLIEDPLGPQGPYFIVLWTKYPKEKDALMNYLEQRLEGVSTPFTVVALDKKNYLDAQKILDSEKLVTDIMQISTTSPQFFALLDWENHLLTAAGDTVASLLGLVRGAGSTTDRSELLSRLLYKLAEAAAGPEHFNNDRFRAVNDALLPVLADRISSLHSGSVNDVWQNAFDPGEHNQALSKEEVASLNRLIHIAHSFEHSLGNERGAVVALPVRFTANGFSKEFAIEEAKAVAEEFFCSSPSSGDPKYRWVLVQSQPACDYAFNQPGTLPFYLGLEFPSEYERKNGYPRASLWRSPRYEFDGAERLLHISARFPVSLSSYEAIVMAPLYRLREQILENLIQHLHSYGSRLGILSFR